MKREPMKWLIAMLVIQFALVGITAEKPIAATGTNVLTGKTDAKQSDPINVKQELYKCSQDDRHSRSQASFLRTEPESAYFQSTVQIVIHHGLGTGITKDGLQRVIRDTELVIIDMNNPKKFSESLAESRVIALCSLMMGNGADVVLIDLSGASGDRKIAARKLISKELKLQLLGHKDNSAKQIGVEGLLASEQLIFITLKDVSTPKEFKVEAMHESEPGFEEQLKKRADAAYAKYDGWMKQDEEKKKAAEEKSK